MVPKGSVQEPPAVALESQPKKKPAKAKAEKKAKPTPLSEKPKSGPVKISKAQVATAGQYPTQPGVPPT